MATKKLVPIDIISSCVCRDAFEVGCRTTKKNQYSIELFFQGTSIFSLYTKPHSELQKIKAEDLVFGSPWQRRLLINEINRNAFSRVGESRGENYLILDFTDFAKDLYRLTGEEEMYLLQTEPSRNNLSLFEKHIQGIVSPWDLPRERLNECLDLYVKDILSRYQRDKIILCRVLHASDYVSSINTIRPFKAPVDTYNSFINYCYDYFERAIGTGLHVIEQPDNAIGDEGQKWGLYSLHFHREYYEYLLSAFDTVFCQYENEGEILDQLKQEFERRLELVRYGARTNTYLILEKRRNAEQLRTLTECNVKLRRDLEEASKREGLLRSQRDSLRRELEKIKLSKSYKIGRFFTYIPRKLRGDKK